MVEEAQVLGEDHWSSQWEQTTQRDFRRLDLQVKLGKTLTYRGPRSIQSSLNSDLDVCGRVKITLLMY